MMDREEALEALRMMMFGRAFDRKAFNLQRQGRYGTYSSIEGQEASVVGAALRWLWILIGIGSCPSTGNSQPRPPRTVPLERYILYHPGILGAGGLRKTSTSFRPNVPPPGIVTIGVLYDKD